MKKPSLDSMVGIWEGQLVSDSAWTPPIFRFRYYFKIKPRKKLLKMIIFLVVSLRELQLKRKGRSVEMYDVTGNFHDEMRRVNDTLIIGKYYSTPNQFLQWLPKDYFYSCR